MGKLETYRQMIREILASYVELDNRQPTPGTESFLLVDETQNHFMWMNTGWEGKKQITGPTAYLRLQDNKIWIEEDWTEEGIATDLLERGVPNEDIVLAFHPPEMRQYTEFAAA